MIISSLLENGVAAFRFGRRDWLVHRVRLSQPDSTILKNSITCNHEKCRDSVAAFLFSKAQNR